MAIARGLVLVVLVLGTLCIGAAGFPGYYDVWEQRALEEGEDECSNGEEDCDSRMVCVNATCSYCETEGDLCLKQYKPKGYNTCQKNKATHAMECRHKPLFPNFMVRDILGTVLGFIGASLAAGGGIGGGGLFVPLFILVVGLQPQTAIPLSKAMILGGAIANLIFNLQKRHPTSNRPLIDFDVAMVMEPVTLGGTIIGVFFNVFFPSWLIVILLVLLLGYTTRRTMKKGISVWKTESRARGGTGECDPWNWFKRWRNQQGRSRTGDESTRRHAIEMKDQSQELVEKVDDPLPPPPSSAENDVVPTVGEEGEDGEDGTITPTEDGHELKILLEKESHTPWKKFFGLFGIWLGIFIISLLKGGHGAPSILGIDGCDVWYWLIVLLALPWVIVVTWLVARRLVAVHDMKLRIGYEFHKGDVHWTRHTAIKYPLLSIIAGVAAGMLGIGGGMVKGPLMLELGMIPPVVSGTSAFMILFTSSSTTMQFLILGLLRTDYACWYAMVGFLGTCVGQKVVNYVVKKYKATSLIILVIGTVIGMSTILMGFSGILQVLEDSKHGKMGFDLSCDKL